MLIKYFIFLYGDTDKQLACANGNEGWLDKIVADKMVWTKLLQFFYRFQFNWIQYICSNQKSRISDKHTEEAKGVDEKNHIVSAEEYYGLELVTFLCRANVQHVI